MAITLQDCKDFDNVLKLFLSPDITNINEFEPFFIDDLLEITDIKKEKIIECINIACSDNLLIEHKDIFNNSYQARKKLVLFLKNGGFESQYKNQLNEFEKQNEKEKLDNEIKNLTKQNLELSNKNAILSETNLKLQNWDIRFRWAIAASTGLLGFIIEYKTSIIKIIVQAILRL